MRRKFRQQKGFTLIEMLVSMTIFIVFTGILINSYSSIVKGQREANEYRIMYVEARRVFETLVQEFRNGMVDYPRYDFAGGGHFEIDLISKDGVSRTNVSYDDGEKIVKLRKSRLAPGNEPNALDYSIERELALNSDAVDVTKFRIYVSPAIDPYDQDYVRFDSNQFHPKITVYAEFAREFADGRSYTMDLQTTVSSRIYNQVY